MKKYNFSFTGRQAGAIGIFYKISDTYTAENVHEALSLLYEDYEHIQGLKITQNSKAIEQPKVIQWQQVRSNRQRERSLKTGIYRLTRSDADTLTNYEY